jgi:hypothetical protein
MNTFLKHRAGLHGQRMGDQKMARLDQSLLLLSKIENRQFSETQPVDLKKLSGENGRLAGTLQAQSLLCMLN